MGKRFLLGMLVVTLTVIVCGAVEGGSLSKQKSLRMNSLRKQAIKSIRVPICVLVLLLLLLLRSPSICFKHGNSL